MLFILRLFLFMRTHVYVTLCAHVHVSLRGQKRALDPLELELQDFVGSELESSELLSHLSSPQLCFSVVNLFPLKVITYN